ncbi:hypothetical protein M076_3292 [Bacteroides fragilis str. 2-F-2 |uniref:Uncharacterized protein n=1 Tax=Bacteroides fragilis str. 2-F-2 \|nr:hypothetical protein M077_3450 [Bacteroides fragilis str. 2-F-2 \
MLRREQIETEKGKRAFVDGLSIVTPGDMKALPRRSEGFTRRKVTVCPA